jgi:ribosomal protein S1
MANESIVTPETIDDLEPKMKVAGKVLKTSLAGAIVDLGIGVHGVIHISKVSRGSVTRVSEVLKEGEEIEVYIYKVNPKQSKIELTMIEPLDKEWNELKVGSELEGTITRIEKYGVFVDVGAERPGLVHISEMAHGYVRQPTDLVKKGDTVEVKVLKINRRKKQIKLSMKALEEPPEKAFQDNEDDSRANEPTPTAFEAAFKQAIGDNSSDSDLADLLASLDEK